MIPELSSDRGRDIADESLHVVLLPGLDGTGRLFVPLLEQLDKSIRPQVISYPTDRPLGYDELVEFVIARLPARGRFVLVGESFSGPVSIRVAAGEPRRCAGLILIATFATNPLPKMIGRLRSALARPLLFRIKPPASFIRWLLLDKRTPRALVELARDAMTMVEPHTLACRVRNVLGADVRAELQNIIVPILYLAASRDRVVGRRSAREIESLAPATVVRQIDAPHFILQNAPAKALEHMIPFIQTQLTNTD